MARDVEHLSPLRRLLIAFVFVLGGAAGFAAGRALLGPSGRVEQPLAFNHRLHVSDVGVDCETCHEGVLKGEHARLPELTLCLDCHDEPLGDSPVEARLFELAEAEHPPSFRKLFRMPDHVYYSHRRHVAIAGLACAGCHGAIADSVEPPEEPLVRISMETCIGCHERSGVAAEREPGCVNCHR